MDETNFNQAFESFINELNSFLYPLMTNKQDVEDLVQDTYLKAISHLNSYLVNSKTFTQHFIVLFETSIILHKLLYGAYVAFI